uniref:Uncharacterized protein n=1 Tax=Medicago truncatula TaxID=3880 RepID=I3S2W2_MEDTR|nr:unknown [Medicago truncatula]
MELVIIGLKDITLKELNLLILFLMLFEKKLRIAPACKVFKFVIRLEVELDQEWVPCSFPRSEKSIQTE